MFCYHNPPSENVELSVRKVDSTKKAEDDVDQSSAGRGMSPVPSRPRTRWDDKIEAIAGRDMSSGETGRDGTKAYYFYVPPSIYTTQS